MTPAVDLSGQVAVVTGGGRGLGRAIALRLASAGAAVAVVARSADQIAETVQVIRQSGGRAEAFVADVTDSDAVMAMAQAVQQTLGNVDLLVNNAGIAGPAGPFWESDPQAWWRFIEINLLGTLLCSQAVAPRMVARRQGRIVTMVSHAGRIPNRGRRSGDRAG
jgi:NAD(P)-dependent dehydrogenase (short-subunit alcohol dehydrogenase family)